MAKKASKDGINVSKAIREFMIENPKASPQEAADALNARHNLAIKAGFVSTVKSNDKRKKGKAKRAAKAAVPNTAKADSGAGFTLESLLGVKKFIDSMGGLKRAKAAVELLGELS